MRLLALAAALALVGCQAVDPACAGRNATAEIPSAERFRAMSPAERQLDAARFNALAQRCGWEP